MTRNMQEVCTATIIPSTNIHLSTTLEVLEFTDELRCSNNTHEQAMKTLDRIFFIFLLPQPATWFRMRHAAGSKNTIQAVRRPLNLIDKANGRTFGVAGAAHKYYNNIPPLLSSLAKPAETFG